MEDLKHMRRFNESEENSNISDISDSKIKDTIKENLWKYLSKVDYEIWGNYDIDDAIDDGLEDAIKDLRDMDKKLHISNVGGSYTSDEIISAWSKCKQNKGFGYVVTLQDLLSELSNYR